MLAHKEHVGHELVYIPTINAVKVDSQFYPQELFWVGLLRGFKWKMTFRLTFKHSYQRLQHGMLGNLSMKRMSVVLPIIMSKVVQLSIYKVSTTSIHSSS